MNLMEALYGEFSGTPAPDRSSLWQAGMTEKEWFDVALKCGELERSYDAIGRRSETAMGHCGAQDWRVIRFNLMAPWERALQCHQCGLWTLVTLPNWKR
jgi:hypothetical protein